VARIPPIKSDRVIVLNASYEMLSVVTLHRAIAYILLEKAEVVAARPGEPLRSASGMHMPIPSVVRLTRFIRLPYRNRVPAWSKAGLLRRDGHICAYCGKHGSTVEHLLPVSRGGPSTWQNTVIACVACNTRKGSRTPAEAHMPLRRPPTVPTVHSALLLALAEPERSTLAALGLVPAIAGLDLAHTG
jgi:5-methylcytosine-specific restriction endonuclease McrA